MKPEKYFFSTMTALLLALLILGAPFANAYDEEEEMLENNIILLDMSCPASSLEGDRLKGWQMVSGDLEDEEVWLKNLRVVTVEEEQIAEGCALIMDGQHIWLSQAFPVDENTLSLSGAVMGSGSENLSVSLLWIQEGDLVSQEAFRKISIRDGERYRFNLGDVSPPEEADAVRIALGNKDEEEAAQWHSILLSTVVSYHPEILVTASRIGFEPEWPKTFTVHSNFRARRAVFVLKDDTDKECYRADLGLAEHIQGYGDSVWPGYYYRGDFSDFQEEGVFTIDVELDDLPIESREIFIQYQLYWNRAFMPALETFKHARSKEASPGDKLVLWEEGGVNPASQAELLWKLARSWSLLRKRFPESPVLAALEEETLYGVEKAAAWFLEKGLESVGTSKEADWYLNALSCIARSGEASEVVLEAAVRLWESIRESGSDSPWIFYAAMDLYTATEEEGYFEYAAAKVPEITLDRVESLLDYESLAAFSVSPHLRQLFSEKGKALLQSAENPYALPQGMAPGEKGFFLHTDKEGAPILQGNTLRVLEAAEVVAQSYRYTADRNFLAFVCDQFSWIWGNNPFDVQLVADQRDLLEDAALKPGAVLHGIGPETAEVDVPAFPEKGAEGWEYYRASSLKNNAAYISALAHLTRIPTVPPRR